MDDYIEELLLQQEASKAVLFTQCEPYEDDAEEM